MTVTATIADRFAAWRKMGFGRLLSTWHALFSAVMP